MGSSTAQLLAYGLIYILGTIAYIILNHNDICNREQNKISKEYGVRLRRN